MHESLSYQPEQKKQFDPLNEYREKTQRLSQLAHLKKYGAEVSPERFEDAFADAFTSMSNLMDKFGITFKEIFLGEDVTDEKGE